MRSVLATAVLLSASAAQSAVVNGDFSQGTTGYALEACARICDRPVDPFLSIGTNGADPYLRVTTSTSLRGVIEASARQDVMITEDHQVLTFDAVQFAPQDDPGSSGTGPFFDALSVAIIDEFSAFHFIFEFEESGPLFNRFNNPLLDVKETAASDPFFSTGVRADLGAFLGQTVTLGVFAFTASDSRILTGGFDNFSLSAASVPAVPVPGSLPLMLGGLAVFGLSRRRKIPA